MTPKRRLKALPLAALFLGGLILITSRCSAGPDNGPNPNLTASFSFSPASPAVGQSVQFTDTSTGAPTSWQWDFGDGGTSVSQNPSHAFATAGARTITLTITKNSDSDSASLAISVGAAGLIASFTYSPALPAPGQSVQFADMSSGGPTTWQWTFGDGGTSAIQNPSHSFTTAGSKTVALTVTNNAASDNISRTITVSTVDVIPADRLIDWSYAGIPGGIPARTTVYTTLSPGSSHTQINSAIASCPSGQVVYLNAGTYNLSGAINFQSKSGVTLRGAGPGRTILLTSGRTAITSGSVGFTSDTNLSSGYAKGSMAVTLASAPGSSYRAGNLIQVDQEDDYDLTWHATGLWAGTRNLRFTARITGISGNTVNFTPPLPYTLTASRSPAIRALSGGPGVSLCGIEDLTIDTGDSDSIEIQDADRCWIKKVEVRNGGTTLGHIVLQNSSQCEIRKCYVHHAYGYPGQAEGYAITLYYGTSSCLVEDTIVYRTGPGVLCESASGCVVAYNYFKDMCRDGVAHPWQVPLTANHGPHGIMGLWEGNIAEKWQNDGYHGSTSHQILLRNNIHGLNSFYTNERRLVDLCRGSYDHSIIGNIIGDASWVPNGYEAPAEFGHDEGFIYVLGFPNPGNSHLTPETAWTNWTRPLPDAKVASTLIRHGNFDYSHRAVVWDSTITSRVLPNSLRYGSKPDFFGSLQWPAIGPDVSGLVNNIPAKARWDAYATSGNLDDLFRD
jgi:PKD repeat protein